MKHVLGMILLAACSAPAKPDPIDAPDAKKKPDTGRGPSRSVAMPSGFKVTGKPRVEAAFLAPEAAWRQLRSRVTQFQAEAVARGRDLCVTFQADRMHVTTRQGNRRTWRLPKGLRLGGVPVHLLLMADYTVKLIKKDLSQVPLSEEVTVVSAALAPGGQTFRLVIKGGRTIRSISQTG